MARMSALQRVWYYIYLQNRLRKLRSGSVDPDAQAYITAAGLTDKDQISAANTFVTSLKTAGIWNKMILLYPYIGGNASAHAVNMKSPGTYNITWVGSPTHNANGVQGDGTTSYGDTGFTPSLPNISNLNQHISTYTNTPAGIPINTFDIGVSASGVFGMASSYSNSVYYYAGQQANVTTYTAPFNGFYLGSTRSVNDNAIYHNNTLIASVGGPAIEAPINATCYVLGMHNLFLSGKPYQMHSLGLSLTATDAANFYAAVQALQTSLGRQV